VSDSRVLVVVRPALGGMRRHVVGLCHRLLSRFDVALAAPLDLRITTDEGTGGTGRTLTRFNLTLPDGPSLPAMAAAAAGLRRLIAQWRPDVVHLHGLQAGLVGQLACSGRSRPRPAVVWTVHGRPGPSPRAQALIPLLRGLSQVRLLPRPDRVVAVSESVRDYLTGRLNLAAGNIVVIPNGVDTRLHERLRPARVPARRSLGLRPEDFVLTFAGRLAREKGLDTLMDVVRVAAPSLPQLRLVVAGEGPERRRLECLAARMPGRVVFAGYLPDVVDVLAAADAFCLPSHSEGLPLALLEAMAAGLPIAASAVGGVSEACRHGREAVLLAPRDVQGWVRAVQLLATDTGLRQALGEAARRRAVSDFSLETMFDRTESLYVDLLEACRVNRSVSEDRPPSRRDDNR